MKTINLSTILLVLLVFLSSFSGSKDKEVFDNGDKWIPADMDTRKTTLLVANFRAVGYADDSKSCKAVNEKMKEVLQECYPYKYAMVSLADLESSKYADKDMYRFVLINNNGGHTMSDPQTTSRPVGNGTLANEVVSRSGPQTTSRPISYSTNTFHIYDRKLDKEYPTTGHSAAYIQTTLRPTLNTIVKYLKGLK